jgi:hypothetical protein
MIKINYPNYPFKIKKKESKEFIFDIFRKKWVKLSPEEWVRQNFLQYLVQEKKYPASIIAVEKEVHLKDIKKRCDIIIYKQAKPYMIVECKEMDVELNEKTISQILTYNIALNVNILVITNGNNTFAFETVNKKPLTDIPAFIN